MIDLTTIILTYNEELNIEKCINSVKNISKRIVVIDSYSTDRTVEIARELGAEVYQNEWTNHATQYRYGIEKSQIDTKWILRLDADERLTSDVASELEYLCEKNNDTDINGIVLRFEVSFLGKKLRHGGIYPFRKLVVYKAGCGDIENRNMDEHIVLTEGRSITTKNDCIHEDYKDLTAWIDKHNKYSTKEVMDYYDNKYKSNGKNTSNSLTRRIYYSLPMGIRPFLYFCYRYIFRLGFLDGKEGLIFNFLQAWWYWVLVDAKIYERNLNDK